MLVAQRAQQNIDFIGPGLARQPFHGRLAHAPAFIAERPRQLLRRRERVFFGEDFGGAQPRRLVRARELLGQVALAVEARGDIFDGDDRADDGFDFRAAAQW